MSDTLLDAVLPAILPLPALSPLDGLLARAAGIRGLEQLYRRVRGQGGETCIAARVLTELQVTVRLSQQDLDRIPRQGPVLLIANHPFGLLDSAVLAAYVARVRPDARFLANGILGAVPELRQLLITVDPINGRAAVHGNHGGVRRAIDFLANGGLLVVFPAGEVAHFQWKPGAVTDPPWNPAISRMLELASRRAKNISVLPVHLAGRNSVAFQAAGLLHPRLRTALLGRELLNKRGTQVRVRIGNPIHAEKLLAISGDPERIEYLRWRTYVLAARNDHNKPLTKLPLLKRPDRHVAMEDVGPASDPCAMAREVQALPEDRCLAAAGDLAVYLARAGEIPAVMTEIGRLREITFRAAGEGTGKALDLDAFDSRYLHLFVWHKTKNEIAGAYRLTGTDTIGGYPAACALYTATLFDYGEDFLARLGPALELGRSFVRAEYQRAFAPLLLLWKGIGKYVARNPRYKILFGPVSISDGYQAVPRRLMVSFLERHAWLGDLAGCVSGRNPFRSSGRRDLPLPPTTFDLDDLSAAIEDLEPGKAGVPVLLRQYLRLGGRLLGFSVDPQFANALDGLILVDLTRTEPKLLERYLGKDEARSFLAYQRGMLCNTVGR